jgi:hypothetical protein
MYAYVRNNPTTLTDPTGLDLNLACATESDTGLAHSEALGFASACSFAYNALGYAGGAYVATTFVVMYAPLWIDGQGPRHAKDRTFAPPDESELAALTGRRTELVFGFLRNNPSPACGQ